MLFAEDQIFVFNRAASVLCIPTIMHREKYVWLNLSWNIIPYLHVYMAIVPVYLISNAELERAFSAMKPVLRPTDWRKSLSTSTINR